MQSCCANNGHPTAQRTKKMDSVNRHTARERPVSSKERTKPKKVHVYGNSKLKIRKYSRVKSHHFVDLLEWRKCQGKAGWYGMLAILVGGSVVFAGLSGFPKLPKKYLPLVSLGRNLIFQRTGHYVHSLASGVGAGCGWFVSYRVITSCHRDLSPEGTVDGKINQLPEKKNDILLPPKETKYGDKGFVKE